MFAKLKTAASYVRREAASIIDNTTGKVVGYVGTGIALVGATTPSYAVIDITAATGGVLDAQTAILAVIGALMTLATTLFGIMMVYRFLQKKSGV